MFLQLTDEELINRKRLIDDQVEALRKKIMIDLNQLEVLCKEGVTLETEITNRINVSNSQQT